ncbi:Multidrug resistance protein Stp [Ralstonia psammae]|uniref:Multidrug resistance protein Stp n=1 Tax=Ralstonia psammae TaxID=3058598 RepID=A0ABN9JGF4_9RALS|nr:MFS transporter [Ralstonia sp. LMG 19083]CAJ0807383.1 Multidrug resistance protein Stp [Ralstonia sp. LMG 19083]
MQQAHADTATPKRLVLCVLSMAVLVAQIDTAVVNLAVRPIGQFFHAAVGPLQWVIDAYNLAYAALLLSGGLLADLYGRRRAFVSGAAVFSVASVLCALAPSIGWLIGARAMAGVGASLLLPASLAILRVVWRDPRERAHALGIWAACNGLAMAIGPTAGGVLVTHFGWRAVFWVVVPVSVAIMVLAVRVVPESSDAAHRRFDALAQVLGAFTLGGLAFAAIEAHHAPAMGATVLAVALIALAWFIRVEARYGSEALVPLELFRVRAFRGAIVATAGMTFGMYGALFLLPLMWQSTGRLNVMGAGIALMPMALVFMVVSPVSGTVARRYGARLATAGGVGIIALGLLTLGASAGAASVVPAAIGLALTGLGMGFATGPLMGAAVGAVGPERSGTASALVNVARMSGATLGVAILGAVYAVYGSGAPGLRVAMLCGGAVQLACAAVAWRHGADRH